MTRRGRPPKRMVLITRDDPALHRYQSVANALNESLSDFASIIIKATDVAATSTLSDTSSVPPERPGASEPHRSDPSE